MAKELAKLEQLSDEDLGKEAVALREEIWKLRLQRATGQLQDTHKVRRTRRSLARILTLQRKRELAAAGGGDGRRRK
jgi:large subunit ribosomal protein L29